MNTSTTTTATVTANNASLVCLGTVQPMPAAEGFTMIAFDASKVPAGTKVYMVVVTMEE